MNAWKRNLQYWGKCWLENMGSMVGASVVFMIFVGMGGAEFYSGNNWREIVGSTLGIYPYYLMLMGSFIILIFTITNFQHMLSVLISMNCTRRYAVLGICGMLAVEIAGMLLLAAVIWLCFPGDIASSGMEMLPLMAGVLWIIGAVSVAVGTIIIRWGKIGTYIFIAVCAIGGCALGFGAIWTKKGQDFKGIFLDLQFNFSTVAVVGIIAYLLASIFAVIATRKIEVQV